MPFPALLLILATLLPLAAFIILLFIGKRMGNPLAGWVGTAFIAGSFICSIVAMISWFGGGHYERGDWGKDRLPIVRTVQWIPVGSAQTTNGISQDHPGYLDVGVYVDSLTIAMFSMITMVAMLVHFFSIGYMADDKRYPRFFTYLGLFCFSMLGLVIGGTALQLFIFWELVGLCSYLLIGFWYEKKSASNAAIKAFVTNRVGDFGFLIGFGILFYHMGNVTLPDLWAYLGGAGSGQAVALPGGVFTPGLLTIMGIGLFFGAVGKSAQFPLHVWLPDAMEGPTPVSALIHAATMVAAGVYLVGRIFPILTPDAKLFIAIIGATTLTMAALIAVAQSDIKKVLAYSTLSQLGYMILAMGIGSWVGGLFHLITHAFFKALLFLGSGSVIHAAHHEQEMTHYGGLMRKIPVTAVTFGIAVLTIAGTPFLSGSYSKSMILTHAGAFATLAHLTGRSSAYWLLWLLPTITAYITAFYMMRCWMLTFWGKPRNKHLYDHAHESPILFVPLVVLAVMSIIGGKFLSVQQLIESAARESQAISRDVQLKDDFFKGREETQAFAQMWPVGAPEKRAGMVMHAPSAPVPHGGRAGAVAITPELAAEAHEHGELLETRWVFWAFAVGLALGFAMYSSGYKVAHALTRIPPLRLIHSWLYHRMYFDELYFSVFVAITMALSQLSAWFDRTVVDGVVNLSAWFVRQVAVGVGLNDRYVIDGAVNGMGSLAQDLGSAVRTPQSGRVRMYVTVLMVAVVLGLAGAIIVVLSR